MGYQDSFYLCSSHGAALFLMARGHLPLGIVLRDGRSHFRFPARARVELDDLNAARDILGGISQIAGSSKPRVAEWLQGFLADGPRTVQEVTEAASAAGISRRRLDSLDVMTLAGAEKVHPSPTSPWYWQLKRDGLS